MLGKETRVDVEYTNGNRFEGGGAKLREHDHLEDVRGLVAGIVSFSLGRTMTAGDILYLVCVAPP